MISDNRLGLSTTAFAAALCMMCIGPVHAQSSGTVESPLPPAARGTPTPTGGGEARMPLATQEQFTNAEKLAPGSVPTGIPGASSTSSSGGGHIVTQPHRASEEAPPAYGSSTAPYTTARVAVTSLGNSSTTANTPVTSYPYRATGKLYFKIGSSTFVCTASLIKKGVLITAAHCVFDYGKKSAGWHTNFVWCPANTSSSGGVYGCYNAGGATIATVYFNGNDTCTQTGVVCNNDLATLIVSPKSSVYAGTVVGWYGYGWNGYSYRASSFLGNVTTVQMTQLGYPVAFDSGYQMERTEAVGWYFTSGSLKNTQIGSAQTGGSSGGPWLVNFGTRPSVGSGASLGSASTSNIVDGVTSYGSTTVGYNRQGASFFGQNVQFPNSDYGGFGAGNIGRIVQATCTAHPTYC